MNNTIHFDFFIHKNKMKEITEKEYNEFLDKFIEFVEKNGYWTSGSSKLCNASEYNEQSTSCKYVKRIGESCTLNNSCKYPNCEIEQLSEQLVCDGNELDCPFDFTSRCTMGRCDCKPKAN